MRWAALLPVRSVDHGCECSLPGMDKGPYQTEVGTFEQDSSGSSGQSFLECDRELGVDLPRLWRER